MPANQKIETLEKKLNDFDPEVRAQALQELMGLVAQGVIRLPPPAQSANMHCHTFFSFNGYGHSPTCLAWLAKRRGFGLMGIVDFDVLDGVDEFLAACEVVGLRGSAGIETRVYLPQFATREINSPGEPGVYYHMGIGFTSGQPPPAAAVILAAMRRRAAERNRAMLARINAHLSPVTLDYERDVLPLTPRRAATERHMLAAYLQAVEQAIPDPVNFWTDKLALEPDRIAAAIDDKAKFQNLVRAKLMKRGGVGYVQPVDELGNPVPPTKRPVAEILLLGRIRRQRDLLTKSMADEPDVIDGRAPCKETENRDGQMGR